MYSILYSCFGTTDPVRGERDGGLMHIMRFYRPEVVYVFLTKEMAAMNREDQRVEKMVNHIRQTWDRYAPEVVCMETDIEDPSDMDGLMEPMHQLFQRALAENPGCEVLLNLSSGTPQMQIILAQLALDTRYPTRGIQVKNPERASGKTARTNVKHYPIAESLELNEDEEPGAPNRCCEPKLMAIRREAVRHQLSGLLSQRNYAAIAQMGADLPAPIPQLARHLDYRSQFQLQKAMDEAAHLKGYALHAKPDGLPYAKYELIEYFAILKSLVCLKRYTDFMLRLNPFLVRLQMVLLENTLSSRGDTIQSLMQRANGRMKIDPEQIAKKYPDLLAAIEKALHGSLEKRDVSIRILNLVLNYFQIDEATIAVLENCERANQELRNSAAHDLFLVTSAQIYDSCSATPEQLLQRLENILVDALSRYQDKNIKKRLNIYEHCDQIIGEACGVDLAKARK